MQVSQSGWQVRQRPEEENELEGQVETHWPLKASWLFAQERQNEAESTHVLQEESHAVHVKLSVGERKVPVGQLSTQAPWESTKPGRHPVH